MNKSDVKYIRLPYIIVEAAERIYSGSGIRLNDEGKALRHAHTYQENEDTLTGMADPFAKKTIEKGEKFRLFLFPKVEANLEDEKEDLSLHAAFLKSLQENPYDKVTRLAFADYLEEQGMDSEAQEQRSWTPEKQKAEEWLRKFAGEVAIPYSEVLQAGYDFAEYQNYYTQWGREDARNAMTEEVQKEFWNNWQIVTGIQVPEDKQGSVFSCSC